MSEEYREYRSRRTPRKSPAKKSFSYLKKLLRQTIFSVIIFSVVISPELLGINSGRHIKAFTKSALLYTVDISNVSNFFKDIYRNSTHKGEEINEESEAVSKNL